MKSKLIYSLYPPGKESHEILKLSQRQWDNKVMLMYMVRCIDGFYSECTCMQRTQEAEPREEI